MPHTPVRTARQVGTPHAQRPHRGKRITWDSNPEFSWIPPLRSSVTSATALESGHRWRCIAQPNITQTDRERPSLQ